jgi:hypothetical protein
MVPMMTSTSPTAKANGHETSGEEMQRKRCHRSQEIPEAPDRRTGAGRSLRTGTVARAN